MIHDSTNKGLVDKENHVRLVQTDCQFRLLKYLVVVEGQWTFFQFFIQFQKQPFCTYGVLVGTHRRTFCAGTPHTLKPRIRVGRFSL